jgi:hypothetical protein
MKAEALTGDAAELHTETIHVRVSPRQRAELEQVAAECGADLSTVIRESVDSYCGDFREAVIFGGGPDKR